MHGDDGARFRPERALDGTRVDAPRVRIDVGEHRRRAGHDDGMCRRRERQIGNDHLVAQADAQRAQCHVQRARAARNGDGMPAPDERRKIPFEPAHIGAGARHPARTHRVGHTFEFTHADDWRRNRNSAMRRRPARRVTDRGTRVTGRRDDVDIHPFVEPFVHVSYFFHISGRSSINIS